MLSLAKAKQRAEGAYQNLITAKTITIIIIIYAGLPRSARVPLLDSSLPGDYRRKTMRRHQPYTDQRKKSAGFRELGKISECFIISLNAGVREGGGRDVLVGQELVNYHGTGEGGDKTNIKCIFQHDLSPRGGSSC